MAVFALPYLRLARERMPFFPYFQEAEGEYSLVLKRFAADLPVGDPWLYEHRRDSFPYPEFSFHVAALFVRLLGTEGFMVVCDLLIPPLVFLAAVYLARELLPRDPALAVFFAFAYTVLFGSLAEYASRAGPGTLIAAAKRMFGLLTHYSSPAVEVTRAPFGSLAVPLILVGLGLVLRISRGDRRAVFAAVPLVMFLMYFRTLPALFVAGVAVFLLIFALRDRQRDVAKRLGVVVATAALVFLPLLLMANSWEHRFPEQAARSGIFHSRTLSVGHMYRGAWFLVLLLPALSVFARGRPELRKFGPGVVLASLLLAHSNLVTGRTGFAHHQEAWCVGPFVVPVSATLAFLLLRDSRRRAALGAAFALILLYAAPRFYFSVPYLQTYDAPTLRELGPLRNVRIMPAGSVVAAPPGFFEIYQDAYVLVPGCGPFSSAGDDEIVERMLCLYRLFDLPPAFVAEALQRPERDEVLALALHTFSWTRRLEVPGDHRRWNAFYEGLPSDPELLLSAMRDRFRVDYVVHTPHFARLGGSARRLEESGSLKAVFRSPSVTVFQVLSP